VTGRRRSITIASVGTAFWAEPMNALKNGAFLIAAGVLLARQRRSGWTDKPLTILALLTASVGIGSFLFHTTLNGLTLWADIVPIAVVILSLFFLALRRFLGLGAIVAGLATAALLVLTPQIGTLMKPILGASSTYAPGLIATFGGGSRAAVRSRSHAADALGRRWSLLCRACVPHNG
jgi:hypothetical protein